MLNSLSRTIELQKSPIYLKMVLLIHCCAFISVVTSSLAVSLQVAMIIMLVWQCIKVVQKPYPQPNYQSLRYEQNHWVLCDKQQNEFLFIKIRVIFKTELFTYFELKNARNKKKCLIFVDQCSTEHYRFISLIETIQSSTLVG